MALWRILRKALPVFPVTRWLFRTQPRYKYRPLERPDEVRFLKVLPGPPRSALECQIFHESLDHAPPYRAVSYAWGTSSRAQHILASGHRLPITPSLHALLLRVRRQDAAVTLWVDQICINQKDDDEKGRQVKLMSEIYQHAEKALIWLGRESWHSRVAMRLARTVLARQEAIRRSKRLGPLTAETWPRAGLPHWNHPHWAMLGSLLRRDWFRRTWVIQETVLAREPQILCGNDEMSWDELMRLIRSVPFAPNLRTLARGGHTSRPLIVQHILAVEACRQRWRRGTKLSLIDLLFQFRPTDSSEDRDKVYSLMGISDQVIQPNYSVPLPEALTEVARKLLNQTLPTNLNYHLGNPALRRQGMGLLYSAGIANQKTAGLPSWVPDWGTKLRARPLWEDAKSGYSAGGGPDATPTSIEFLPGDKIATTGKVCDTILHTTQALDYRQIRGAMRLHEAVGVWFQAARGILPSSASSPASESFAAAYPSGLSVLNAFKRTLIANRVADNALSGGYRPATQLDVDRYYRAFEHFYEARVDYGEGFRLLPHTMDIGSFHNVLAESDGRLFFVTARGYVGLATKGISIGDRIAVIKGGDVPVVLRDSDRKGRKWRRKRGLGILDLWDHDTGDEFSLVSECYVHGIMDGEVMENAEIAERSIVLV